MTAAKCKRVLWKFCERIKMQGHNMTDDFDYEWPMHALNFDLMAVAYLLSFTVLFEIITSHASAVAQGNVVRAMSASYGKSLYSTLRTNQTP
jgi:hypothetical protein